MLAEAPIGYYREGGLRVSSYTGLPTLLGMHEREQRPWEQVGPRERDAERLFTDRRSRPSCCEILARYRRALYLRGAARTRALRRAGPGQVRPTGRAAG